MEQKYVTYCRVSTKEQGESGLGLDAQLATCRAYVEREKGKIIGEFYDIKSGSSRNRPGFLSALAMAKENDATLVFAKLDRLARDAEYAYQIKNSGIKLYFCDFPEITSLMFGILVAVAQYEKELGQKRTKDALLAIKKNIQQNGYHTSKNGNAITHLGGKKGWEHTEMANKASAESRMNKLASNPERKRQWLLMKELRSRGDTLSAIAETMNAMEEKSPTGKEWTRAICSKALSEWGKYFNK